MARISIFIQAFILSTAVTLYVSTISFIMNNAEKWVGEKQSILGPVAFLMLFVLSAAVVGSLVFGRPVLLYVEGQKREAVKLLIYTIFLLLILTAAVLVTVALI